MACLMINVSGSEEDWREFPLPAEGRVTIGRERNSQVVLPFDSVSRAHAVILCAAGQYQIEDPQSRGGTFVGTTRIREKTRLRDGDQIHIASATLVFHELREVDSPSPTVVLPAAAKPAVVLPAAAKPAVVLPAAAKPAAAADFAVPDELYSNECLALKKRVHEKVLEKLNLREIASKQMEDDEMRRKMEQALEAVLREIRHELPPGLSLKLFHQAMLDELVAYGPITSMLNDPSVNEIMVNGAARIFVDQGGLKETRARFSDDQHLMAIIRRIVERVNRRIDEGSPKVDARLPDGSRVNAIIPPLALDGPVLTIRKFSDRSLNANDLVKFGTLTPVMAKFLEEAVRAKQNIVVSGGTGSGKTTLLNVLSQFIPPSERIITIEDSAELRLNHRNLVRLESRPSNVEGKGRITIQDLVINALRMRPDRIVVGECRGAEALDMLQAMNTGHDGSLTTVHANNPRDTLSRLETMVMMAGYDLPSRAIRDQITAAINLVVQQTRFPDNSRKIEKISEITGREGDMILMQDIFEYVQEGFDSKGGIQGRFRATGNKPQFVEALRKKGDLRLDLAVFKTGT